MEMQIVKIGGGSEINIRGILMGVKAANVPTVIVHGANAAMKELSTELGREEVFLTSPTGQQFRYSDRKTMELFTAAYCGIANKRITALALSCGMNAVGLSGIDNFLWQAVRKQNVLAKDAQGKVKVVKDNYHGKVIKTNAEFIQSLLAQGTTPIITAPAVTEAGEIVNVDNDVAIAQMVEDLGVKKAYSFIEAPGVLADFTDPNSLIREISAGELSEKLADFSGRMKKKILGATLAFANGLEELIITDGRIESPFEYTALNIGTKITK